MEIKQLHWYKISVMISNRSSSAYFDDRWYIKESLVIFTENFVRKYENSQILNLLLFSDYIFRFDCI